MPPRWRITLPTSWTFSQSLIWLMQIQISAGREMSLGCEARRCGGRDLLEMEPQSTWLLLLFERTLTAPEKHPQKSDVPPVRRTRPSISVAVAAAKRPRVRIVEKMRIDVRVSVAVEKKNVMPEGVKSNKREVGKTGRTKALRDECFGDESLYSTMHSIE